VSIDGVERAVVAASRRWNLAAVAADTWQSAQLSERLRVAGVPAATIDATGSNLREQANQLLQVFNESRIDLYPDDALLRDLRAARVEERQYGFRVTSPRDETGHGDTLSAFLLALLAARRLDHVHPVKPNDELVCWP
jgi:phage terminase large subunit-like protein